MVILRISWWIDLFAFLSPFDFVLVSFLVFWSLLFLLSLLSLMTKINFLLGWLSCFCDSFMSTILILWKTQGFQNKKKYIKKLRAELNNTSIWLNDMRCKLSWTRKRFDISFTLHFTLFSFEDRMSGSILVLNCQL